MYCHHFLVNSLHNGELIKVRVPHTLITTSHVWYAYGTRAEAYGCAVRVPNPYLSTWVHMKTLYLKEEQQNAHICNNPRYPIKGETADFCT